jgi:hypothetical protein
MHSLSSEEFSKFKALAVKIVKILILYSMGEFKKNKQLTDHLPA